jgi:hypothetical protein
LRADEAARRGMERRGRLADLLAIAAEIGRDAKGISEVLCKRPL